MWIRLAVIIAIIASVSGGIYSLLLLFRLRKIYRIDYLNSFFYYKILHFVFGIYGILGGVAIGEILLKYDIKSTQLESIVTLIPLLGIPFIIAAWYLLIKTANELTARKVHQYVSVIYFILVTILFLVYGLILRDLPDDSRAFTGDPGKAIKIVFYVIDLGVKLYIFILLLTAAVRSNNKLKNRLFVRFGGILAGMSALAAAALHFSELNIFIGVYFLLTYFGSDLVLIFLLKEYLRNNEQEYAEQTDNIENTYQKYGISKRERQIIAGICDGKTNREIADELFITLQTVKDHTYNIYRKVNVRNRVQLTQLFSGLKNE